jgi:pimeloyl-ACP methyl ester carboxylesterase
LGFTTRHFDLPGLRLHAAVAGPEGGEPVILLHGFPEFWYGWRAQLPALAAAGFRVVAPDQRGYNLSGKAPPYDQRTLANDVLHLMAALGVGAAHVVGHDWGAVVAWRLAEWHPERLRTLTILNVPHPLVGVRAVRGGNLRQALRSTYVGFFQLRGLAEWLLRRRDFALMRRAMRASSAPGTFSEADLDRYAAAWAQPGALSAMLGWYRAFSRWTWPRLLRPPAPPSISVPSVILWGEQDTALGVELAEASARLLRNGRLIRFPGVSHWVQHEASDRVNAELLRRLGAAG